MTENRQKGAWCLRNQRKRPIARNIPRTIHSGKRNFQRKNNNWIRIKAWNCWRFIRIFRLFWYLFMPRTTIAVAKQRILCILCRSHIWRFCLKHFWQFPIFNCKPKLGMFLPIDCTTFRVKSINKNFLIPFSCYLHRLTFAYACVSCSPLSLFCLLQQYYESGSKKKKKKYFRIRHSNKIYFNLNKSHLVGKTLKNMLLKNCSLWSSDVGYGIEIWHAKLKLRPVAWVIDQIVDKIIKINACDCVYPSEWLNFRDF